MDRQTVHEYIKKKYKASPEYPWRSYPGYAVFRHEDNKKWFALYMEIERKRLGLEGSGAASILNVKTGPLLQGSYLGKPGILPAYHMNKTNWVSIVLDTADQKTFEELLDISWELTK